MHPYLPYNLGRDRRHRARLTSTRYALLSRLQVLLRRAQQQLASMIEPPTPSMVPVVVNADASRGRLAKWR